MEYGTELKTSCLPTELVECKNGLQKITTFDEIIPFTIRALLKCYNCTESMLDKVENSNGIIKNRDKAVEFYITYNPHIFATCLTNLTKNIYVENEQYDTVEQNEILDLVESLPGSLKRPGLCQYLKKIDQKNNKVKIPKLIYEYPIFDTGLRYLVLSRYKISMGEYTEDKYMMVLYLPE